MSRPADPELLAYLGEACGEANHLSELLQEAYKNLRSARAIFDRSRWYTQRHGPHRERQGGDLTIWDETPGMELVLDTMSYLASSMESVEDVSSLLDAARAAELVYNETRGVIRQIEKQYKMEAVPAA